MPTSDLPYLREREAAERLAASRSEGSLSAAHAMMAEWYAKRIAVLVAEAAGGE